MLTNNFHNALRGALSMTAVASGLRKTDGSAANADGTINNASVIFDFYKHTNIAANSKSKAGLVFGTGNTPPTIDDYWLSGDLITGTTIVARNTNSHASEGKNIIEYVITVGNSNADTIVINEFGLVGSLYVGYNQGTICMLDRVVLDAPLTLASGEQGVITYTINVPIVQ